MSEVDTTAAATTENVNTNNEAPVTEAPVDATAEQVAKFLGTDVETLEKFTKFTTSNGDFNKAFSKLKTDISAPNTEKAPEPVENPQPAQPQQPAGQPQQTETAEQTLKTLSKGFVSPQAFLTRQYFKTLATEEKYAPIAKDIESGSVIKEMEEFGIHPTDEQGNFNDNQVRKFLDLKAQTVPATPSVAEPTTTPTVTFTDIEGEITTFEQAQKVFMESVSSRARGAGEHPKLEEAKKFLANSLK